MIKDLRSFTRKGERKNIEFKVGLSPEFHLKEDRKQPPPGLTITPGAAQPAAEPAARPQAPAVHALLRLWHPG
ncbi:MAG: hypothetical protein KUA33_03495, partial [Methanobacterium sp.]|nr:hypothetical protein [Methanobacterium sp.]